MQKTVYNPQKGRLETIDIAFTDENTTWFDDTSKSADVSKITDFEGGGLSSLIAAVHTPFGFMTCLSLISTRIEKAFKLLQLIYPIERGWDWKSLYPNRA